MSEWDQAYIDLVVPGYIEFTNDMQGSFIFGTVTGWLDCRIEQYNGAQRIEFSWEGNSDSDPACGRGWATLNRGALEGHLFIHNSDDSSFLAHRMK